ncbi:MAG: tandem-95 repeat protein [Candidatus Rokubacteria bacterium]|nr:tandem-95 repeat protein [Candidatus Rokubacteria bacterium]
MSREALGGSSMVDGCDFLSQPGMPGLSTRRRGIPSASANFGLVVWLALMIAAGIAASGAAPASAAIIDNGTVQLGINDAGHLIVPETQIGLRYIPSGGESLAPGCDCEGWGVANADTATTTFAGYAQIHDGPSNTPVGVVGLIVQSETGVTVASGHTQENSVGSAFKSVVTTSNGRLKITHEYRPSPSANLYEIVVTIENIGSTSIGDLRYRRLMDWDIPPFVFDEWVKIHIGSTANFLRATTDGFQLANPLESAGPTVGSPPTTLTGIGDYSGGSSDQGALFDFAFGSLAPGQIRTFRLYYGAATTEAAALAAIGAVSAPVYSLGIPRNDADTGPDTDGPHVFIFAAKAVNDNPTISDITDKFTNEDTPSGPHSFTVGDAETPAASLTVSGSSSNTTLVPNANIVFGGSGANRTVTVTPAPNQNGTATITVTVSDGAGGSASDSFLLTVNSVNDNPTITDISDQVTNEDTPSGPHLFTVGDVETPAGSLTLAGSSSNLTLVPTANIVFGGAGASRTVTVTPAPNQFGTATITVTVTDADGGSASDSFVLMVNSVNDAPSFITGPNQTRFEDAGPQTVLSWATTFGLISPGPENESDQTLSFIVTNDNNALFSAQPAVSPDGTLTFTSAFNKHGMATVTVKLMDNGGTANGGVDTSAPQAFTITVEPVNDPPVTTADSKSTAEDTPLSFPASDLTVNDTPGPADESGQTLTVSGVSSPSTAGGTVALSAGTVTYSPAANFFGPDSFTYTVCDNGSPVLCAPGTVNVTVTAVNDAPFFDPIADQFVNPPLNVDQNVDITGVAPGPNEAEQTVTLTATSSNTALISNPTITGSGSTRTLTYQRVSNGSGTVTITVTANDGEPVNNTFSRSFTITVGQAAATAVQASFTGFSPNPDPMKAPTVEVTLTFGPIDFDGDGVADCYFFFPPRTPGQPYNVIPSNADRVPEGPPWSITKDLVQNCGVTQTFTAELDLSEWITTPGTQTTDIAYVSVVRDLECLSDPTTCGAPIWTGIKPVGSLTFTTGHTVADKNTVTLHTVNIGGGASTKAPLAGAQVRVFDRNNPDFQVVAGSKNPDGSLYGVIWEADKGRVGACTTDSTGVCLATEAAPGDYLVIVKCINEPATTGNTCLPSDTSTSKSVYVGRPKSPSDFVNGIATKDFQIIKVFKNGVFQGFRGGSKTVMTGSVLEMIAPDSAIWEGTSSIYPFIFTSDSNWTVDVCAQVPAGYSIVGVYDESGNLISSTNCAQTFVAGQTKIMAFEVVETSSPEPSLDAELTIKAPDGKKHVKKVRASDIRKATFDAEVAKVKAKK